MAKILRVLGERDPEFHAFVHVAVYTGMRRSELIALRFANVEILEHQQHAIRVREAAVKVSGLGLVRKAPKTAKGNRTIDLDARTTAVLCEHKERVENRLGSSELVFPGRDGNFSRPTTLDRKLKHYAELAGVDSLTLHSFRHFHASVALGGVVKTM